MITEYLFIYIVFYFYIGDRLGASWPTTSALSPHSLFSLGREYLCTLFKSISQDLSNCFSLFRKIRKFFCDNFNYGRPVYIFILRLLEDKAIKLLIIVWYPYNIICAYSRASYQVITKMEAEEQDRSICIAGRQALICFLLCSLVFSLSFLSSMVLQSPDVQSTTFWGPALYFCLFNIYIKYAYRGFMYEVSFIYIKCCCIGFYIFCVSFKWVAL